MTGTIQARISRRTFGKSLVAAGLGYAVPARAEPSQKQPIMIDTHSHVFHRGLQLADSRRYAPGYDAPLDLYLQQLDDNGISNGVLVQPSFLGTDNSYLVQCVLAARGRLSGIAVVDPNVTSDDLNRLNDSGIVGLRLNLVGKPLPDLASPAWGGLLERAEKLQWQIEVQRAAIDLAALAPALLAFGVNVVLDHYALPNAGTGAADPGFVALAKLGQSRRLWVKVSAPYRIGEDCNRIAREAFVLLRGSLGRDRLIWGSDWPHTQFESTQTYAKALAAFGEIVGDPDDRTAILQNPRDLFRFS
ncbi:Predicted metal-dependent hydrolase, TIM-barrel fold [Bradyrhizobium erythrophlei]|jgi:predicted TIM-barrel fold metal-dependent hydrolase|nr:Predicted metal-dependent hydrolase, TIM-barrel fold [Bradyrhizobium erythrophlei]